jgi:hypothetical protein
VCKNPTSKGRFEISIYDSKWRIEEAITKRISMVVGECNNRWKLLLRNASCGDINVEQNWNLKLGNRGRDLGKPYLYIVK